MIHRVGTIGRNVHLEGGLIPLAADRLDCNPRQSQIIGKLMVVDVEVNKIAQPLRRNFHRSWKKVISYSRRSAPASSGKLTVIFRPGKSWLSLACQISFISLPKYNTTSRVGPS